jgi:anti-sigma B factor antagonist
MLRIDVGDAGQVRFVGRLDAVQAPGAQSVLDGLSGAVTIDCGELEYISSAGLGVLLKTHKRLASADGGLRLVAMRHHVRDIFKYSGFDRIFQIESDPAH